MSDFDDSWLKLPGEQLFLSLDKGNQLDSRITNLELNPTGVTAAINPRCDYSSTSTYTNPDIVVGSDGNTYICKATTTVSNIDPTVDTSVWTIFIERGLQGIAGKDGNQGIQGLQGELGINGKDESQGLQGIQGLTGPQGPAGKDTPAASITLSSLAPTLQKDISDAAKLVAGSSEGSWGEIDTGKSFRGKKVYRCDFTLYINADANVNADLTLNSTPNFVSDIISVGGYWDIEFGSERWCIPSNTDGSNYAYVLLYGTNNLLTFRSKANNKRTSAISVIIVEYTKR